MERAAENSVTTQVADRKPARLLLAEPSLHSAGLGLIDQDAARDAHGVAGSGPLDQLAQMRFRIGEIYVSQ